MWNLSSSEKKGKDQTKLHNGGSSKQQKIARAGKIKFWLC